MFRHGGDPGLVIAGSQGFPHPIYTVPLGALEFDTLLYIFLAYVKLAFHSTLRRMTNFKISIVSDTVCPWVSALTGLDEKHTTNSL